ncbi:hypothetical protein [Vibrio europaeus]|uniref:hypothetical protein n=1 Tax=Vibrio europaeus TaxID=300876 RepID=UPI00148B79AF|nr:hypothetical protein [Vibrio europaeus]MDC5822039.1 hypothetical protein [Vibrio europaeus]MDC5837980.1 hypothetical protein [Vibrio europaeus]MDC5855124.1 hypothetical protein [Vibrio europaeus]MDC5870114.1 hypothetical protein [Vibrio europaeus]NOH22768.1 hypothetical protein [Vibrio europaeus]
MNGHLELLTIKKGSTDTKSIFTFYMLALFTSHFYFLVYPYIVFVLTKGWGGNLYLYTDLEVNLEFFRGFLISVFVLFSYLMSFLFIHKWWLTRLEKEINTNFCFTKRMALISLAISIMIYLPWLGVDRAEYKSSVGFWPGEILISTAMMFFLFAVRGGYKEKLISSFVFLIIILSIREREYILFIVALFWFSIEKKRSKFLLALLGVMAILFYKSIFNYITGNASPTFLFDDVYHFMRFSAADARHALNLMQSYLLGEAPSYIDTSIYFPHWIQNLFGANFESNSRMASEYYTENMTGTGFNHALELWLNFGPYLPIFCFISTAGLALLARLGPILIVPVLTFIIKAARGDLSALVVVWIILPSLLLICLYVIDRFLLQNLTTTLNRFRGDKGEV